jgi:hypothetical protein
LTPEQVGELGEAIYERRIKSLVEPQLHGKFLAIDVETGEYESGDRTLEAIQRAIKKMGDRRFYIKRVGYEAAARIGYGVLENKP